MEKRLRVPFIAILTALLCFALAFGLCFGLAKADGDTPETPVTLSSVDDFVIDETGKLTGLSERGGAKISDGQYFELVIPANVTWVYTMVFRGSEKLVRLSFAVNSQFTTLKSNHKFGYSAFDDCTALKEVDLTNATALFEICKYAFKNCTSLETVVFADSLKDNAKMTISDNAFQNTALTSFEIPAYVNSIASSAFTECSSLKTLTVADGNPKYTYYSDASGNRYDQAVYEKSADGNITALAVAPTTMTRISVPKAVLDVNYVPEEDETEETTAANIANAVADKAYELDSVLSVIAGLETIAIEENDELYAYGNCLFVKEGSKLTSDVLDVSQSANDLFTVPYAVKEITLPAGFIYDPVDGGHDYQVTNFWYYFLESTASNVGGFVPMRQLERLKVDANNTVYTSFEGSLFKKDYSECHIPYAAKSFTLPAQMTEFDFSAFSNHPFLTSIQAEEGHPDYSSDHSIIYNKGKTEVVFVPSNITEFYVPETLETISETAFKATGYNKNSIRKVYVTDLEKWSQIQFGDPIETDEQYEQNPDGSLSKERRSDVAYGLLNGRGANPMSGGADMYVKKGGRWELLENLVLDFDGEISELAFAGCTSVRTVTVSNKITRIGEMAFAMCKNIRSMSVPFIGDRREFKSIFGKGYQLSTYAYTIFGGRGRSDYSDSVGYILAPERINTFIVTSYNIEQAPEIREGGEDVSGNQYPFYGIPTSAFRDAPIDKVIISIDNTDGHDIKLGFGAFSYSTIKEVDLENSKVTHSNASVFSESGIKEVTLPKTMTEIPTNFFFDYSTQTVEKVNIPDTVENIESQIFTNLNVLILPASIGGLGHIDGVKTVYLTGWTDRTDQGYKLYDYLIADTIYVATDATVYKALPEHARVGSESDTSAAYKKMFYQADVVFKLKDSTGKVIAEKTETHLAAQQSDTTAYIKYSQIQAENGDVYWAIDESYALPDTVGNYKVDNTKWTLDGAAVTKDTCLRGDKAQYVIEQTLPAGSNILLTPENVTKQYDGAAWTLPEGMVTDYITVDAGGNGYSSYRGNPVDVGTYTVRAKCKTGYAWYDDPTASPETVRTFTLQITPVSVAAEWFYSSDGSAAGQNVTGTAPERMYDGNSPHRWFYAEFTDISGKKRRADFTALELYVSGDRSTPVYSMTDVGSYEITVGGSGKTTDSVAWLGNYVFENSLQFAVTPRVIDLNDYANLSWGLDAYGSLLRDGDIYMYDGVPYAYTQSALGAPDSTLHVLGSVVRLRSADNHKIAIINIPELFVGSGAQYTAVYSGNTADKIGKYTATAVLTVSDPNYVFGYGLGSDLTSRGMTITINPDGTATIDKVWYVVAIDNGMLNADGAEYKIDGWTFGDDVTVVAPRLEHGDEDESNYLSNGKVLFTLARNGETLANGFGRNVFGYYINKSMPAGRYELVCVVSDVTVGNHTHWWNNEVHDGADADVLYHGFTRTLVFEIQAADIGFTLSAPTEEGYASYEWELNGNKETFFSEFEAAVNAVGKVVLVSVDPQGYWSEHKEYYGGYSLSYNFARMSNNTYLTATDGNLQKYIDGGAKGTYSVYFQITAPNHAPLTDMGDGRYSYFFTVVVFETVDPVDIHVENVTYTGVKNIPALSETDIYHVVLDETDNYIDGGEHTLYLVLNDSVHYRWKGVAAGEAGLSVKYSITKALNEFIEAPDIVRWIEGKFNEEENGFIGAAKFGNISYVITDTNDNVIYDLSQGIDNRASMKAGTYILKATVAGNDNYSGLSEAFTIRILEKVGLPWWGTLLIVLGSLMLAALIIFILWKKGVFQIMTEKIVVAIRTRASVDATIASVRAAKKEDEAKKTVAAAEAQERAEARRVAAKAEREKPAEERAAALEAKAQAQVERAEKMRLRAEALQARAARLRGAEQPTVEEPTEEAAATEAEAAATEETPTDE